MIDQQQAWRGAYLSFVERKTRIATAAVMPPYVTGLDAPDRTLQAIGNAWSASRFDGPFYVAAPTTSRRPVCSLVFVQSVDGNTVASDPSTLGGGETDKHLVYEGLSRVAADAVLGGARTVRGGDLVLSVWHPALVDLRRTLGLPRHPVQVVATLGGGVDIERGLLFNVPEVPVVVLTLSGGAAAMAKSVSERPWIRLITIKPPGDLVEAFESLRELGIGRVSCIGGRTLATELLDRDLIDDVYLTTSPRPGGEPHTPLVRRRFEASVVVRKHGTAGESGVLFEHFHRRPTTSRS